MTPQIIEKIRSECIRRFRYWRLLSARKLLYFPHILQPYEKRFFIVLLLIVILSGGAFFFRLYLSITYPAPQIAKSYNEGILKEPRSINPLFALQDAERDITGLIFSGLLSYSGSGEIVPDLAQSYEISADGKSYTLILRENAFWHDGKKVDADDVIFTIQTIQNPLYKSVLRANWQGVNAEALNQHTVRFTLRAPYASFIENLTTGIIPKHLWSSLRPEQAPLHELNLKPIGSGPYQFDRLKQAKDGTIEWYRLRRNPNYFLEGPYLKRITFSSFRTENELLSAWKKGLIDGFGPLPPSSLKELNQNTSQILSVQMPRVFGIFFNAKKSASLGELKMRRAISLAIDKQELVDRVLPGGAVPTDSLLPLLGLADIKQIYDPEESKKLLEGLGWKDTNGNGIREKIISEKGKNVETPLRFTLITSDWTDLLEIAEALKQMLKEVGIDIVVEKRPFSELESAVLRPRNFEILLFGQVYGYEPDPFSFWHSSQIKDPGLNVALYASKKADQILEEARRMGDAKERRKKYEEFSVLLNKDLPAVFLYSQLYLYLLPSDMQGVNLAKISLPSDRFNEIHKWHRETKRIFAR